MVVCIAGVLMPFLWRGSDDDSDGRVVAVVELSFSLVGLVIEVVVVVVFVVCADGLSKWSCKSP